MDGAAPTPRAAGDRTATAAVRQPSAVSATRAIVRAAAGGARGLPVRADGAAVVAAVVGVEVVDSEVAAAVSVARSYADRN